MKKKSGKIELLRFIFSLIILVHHMNLHFWDMKLGYHGWILGRKGYIGVEFFFLVSGFLMAASISRMPADVPVLKGSIRFVWKKIKAILPYHIPLYWGTLFALSLGSRTVFGLVKKYGLSFFFLERVIPWHNDALMGLEWYLSSMFFMMLLICPFFLMFREKFSRYIAPVVMTLALAFIFMKEGRGKLGGITIMWGLIFKCNVRALAELCMGIILYELCQVLKKTEWSSVMKVCFKSIEAIGYLAAICYASNRMTGDKDMLILFLLAGSVLISFTGKGLWEEKEWLSSRACFYLGGLSLPIYLSQSSAYSLIKAAGRMFGNPEWFSATLQSAIYLSGTFAMAIFLYEVNRRRLFEKCVKIFKKF